MRGELHTHLCRDAETQYAAGRYPPTRLRVTVRLEGGRDEAFHSVCECVRGASPVGTKVLVRRVHWGGDVGGVGSRPVRELSGEPLPRE